MRLASSRCRPLCASSVAEINPLEGAVAPGWFAKGHGIAGALRLLGEHPALDLPSVALGVGALVLVSTRRSPALMMAIQNLFPSQVPGA